MLVRKLIRNVSCVHVLVFLVFFFKQKTAYEMRISDWSSDVCSSDLPGVVHPGEGIELLEEVDEWRDQEALPEAFAGKGDHQRDQEIGRASCRERVCQYV